MLEKDQHHRLDRPSLQSLTGADFAVWISHALATGQHVIAAGNQGVVLHYRDHKHDLAIKCVTGNALARSLRGWMLGREYRAFQRLENVPGLPHCHGMPTAAVLVLEYIPGIAYRQARLEDRERWFAELEQLVRRMHARGVSHGDLKRKANLLAGADGHPYVLDLGTVVSKKSAWHVCNNWLFRQHCRADINAVLKHKYRGCYDQITGTDRDKLHTTGAEWLWRKMRHWLGLQH